MEAGASIGHQHKLMKEKSLLHEVVLQNFNNKLSHSVWLEWVLFSEMQMQ